MRPSLTLKSSNKTQRVGHVLVLVRDVCSCLILCIPPGWILLVMSSLDNLKCAIKGSSARSKFLANCENAVQDEDEGREGRDEEDEG